jgi:hypothetical protein
MRIAMLYAFHDDACYVIALDLARRTSNNTAVSDNEVNVIIRELIRGSVIHGRVDEDGSPKDLNGNPFLIKREINKVSVSTVWSLWQPFGNNRVVEVESHNK